MSIVFRKIHDDSLRNAEKDSKTCTFESKLHSSTSGNSYERMQLLRDLLCFQNKDAFVSHRLSDVIGQQNYLPSLLHFQNYACEQQTILLTPAEISLLIPEIHSVSIFNLVLKLSPSMQPSRFASVADVTEVVKLFPPTHLV